MFYFHVFKSFASFSYSLPNICTLNGETQPLFFCLLQCCFSIFFPLNTSFFTGCFQHILLSGNSDICWLALLNLQNLTDYCMPSIAVGVLIGKFSVRNHISLAYCMYIEKKPCGEVYENVDYIHKQTSSSISNVSQ